MLVPRAVYLIPSIDGQRLTLSTNENLHSATSAIICVSLTLKATAARASNQNLKARYSYFDPPATRGRS